MRAHTAPFSVQREQYAQVWGGWYCDIQASPHWKGLARVKQWCSQAALLSPKAGCRGLRRLQYTVKLDLEIAPEVKQEPNLNCSCSSCSEKRCAKVLTPTFTASTVASKSAISAPLMPQDAM